MAQVSGKDCTPDRQDNVGVERSIRLDRLVAFKALGEHPASAGIPQYADKNRLLHSLIMPSRQSVRTSNFTTCVLVFLFSALITSDALAEPPTAKASKPVDALEALKRLKAGNARFVKGKPQHPHETSDWRHRLEREQHPYAVVLGCSDSRVPPELVFDQGFGDLFVVRVAGNVVDTDVTASVEYAIDHLDTQLIVVMGHSNCGAVTATLDHLSSPDGEPAEVVSLLYRIEPAIIGVPSDLPRTQRISSAVQRNVELAVRRLSRVPDLRRSINAGKIKIVGAVYDMHTGKIKVLD